jgi:hypothetical protein
VAAFDEMQSGDQTPNSPAKMRTFAEFSELTQKNKLSLIYY